MDKIQIAELKWCKGEPQEKSKKKIYVTKQEVNVPTVSDNYLDNFKIKPSNKREDVDAKLINRVNLGNVNQNPFLINNNYVTDLQNHSDFMIPKNSNYLN